jgi:hypothetical protein
VIQRTCRCGACRAPRWPTVEPGAKHGARSVAVSLRRLGGRPETTSSLPLHHQACRRQDMVPTKAQKFTSSPLGPFLVLRTTGRVLVPLMGRRCQMRCRWQRGATPRSRELPWRRPLREHAVGLSTRPRRTAGEVTDMPTPTGRRPIPLSRPSPCVSPDVVAPTSSSQWCGARARSDLRQTVARALHPLARRSRSPLSCRASAVPLVDLLSGKSSSRSSLGHASTCLWTLTQPHAIRLVGVSIRLSPRATLRDRPAEPFCFVSCWPRL